jgi:DNA-binding beta-propeller fold protein YncE
MKTNSLRGKVRKPPHWTTTAGGMLAAAAVALTVAQASAQDDDASRMQLPTGQYVTPTALPGAVQQYLNPGLKDYPNFIANEAVSARLSPDGRTLLVLCAGYNSNLKLDTTAASGFSTDTAASNQYIFVYDVSGGNKAKPALAQVIQQTNSYIGLVWAPDGKTFYATGGNDDAVYQYSQSGGKWTQAAKIGLGHNGVGIGTQYFVGTTEPNAAGLGISPNGKTLVVANNYNDSISVIDTASGKVRYEHDLRPYAAGNEGTDGGAGGTFPVAVAVTDSGTAYVTANRDREVDVVDISSSTAGKLVTRIKLDGMPNGVAMNKAQTRVFVAQDNADEVAVIDTATNAVNGTVDTRAPQGMLQDAQNGRYTGAAPIAVTLSPDEKTLYAVNDGANSIAVVALSGAGALKVKGLIPTAYGPKDVALSKDGPWMYIVNGKSDQGPNPLNLYATTNLLTTVTYPGGNTAANAAAQAANQYQLNNNRSTLVSARVPAADELEDLTELVARNNYYSEPEKDRDAATMAFVRSKIKHVIYIIKENRTFDQILGDLGNGSNGDASLAVFGQALTPSFHKLARDFVTLDNFLDTGDASMDGWSWSLQGRATSTTSLTQNINYAAVDRGLSYLTEATNRNVPVGLPVPVRLVFGPLYTSLFPPTLPGGIDNVLAGTGDVAASDAPFGASKGYIFDAVLAAGGTVRNYGFMVFNAGPITVNGQPVTNAGAAGIPQAIPLNPSLFQLSCVDPALFPPCITDVFFRGFDNAYPDLYRYYEWKREFDAFVQQGNLPTMETVRFSHDHTGNFDTAISGVNTPETQQADNDYSTGKLIEAVANSPYAKDTLIFVIEDDSQDGPDHVDSHRTTAYIVGPYVKKHAVVSRHYTSVNWIRTIEDVLGVQHLNLNTAYQPPMADVFDTKSDGRWTFTAEASTILKTTTLASAEVDGQRLRFAAGPIIRPRHDAAYWAEKTKGFDFSDADRIPFALYNKVLWEGLMPGKPYPAELVRTTIRKTAGDQDD